LQQQQQQQPYSTTTAKTKKKWAYAFLMAGCDLEAPLTYKNYIYNILVATKLLRQGNKTNTTTDVIVMVQFLNKNQNASNSKEATPPQLPSRDLQWFQHYNIQVAYLPPAIRDNFYNAQLEKFRILQLTQYSRIMYLDADVLPLCSLDYLLELSGKSLQPNIILSWFTEPAHGGLFVLEPGQEQAWHDILRRREQEALDLPYPHWDPAVGWGQQLTREWQGLPQILDGKVIPPRHSMNWTFHGDFADQGLLYFWTMFYKRQVSIVQLDHIENWDHGRLVERLPSRDLMGNLTCLPIGMEYPGHYGSTLVPQLFLDKIPHRDFVHFSGDSKPWEHRRSDTPTVLSQVKSSTDYWYYQLGQIFQEFAKRHPGRRLPTFPLKFKKPSLGRYPTHRSMIGSIHKKKKKEQQQHDQEPNQPQHRNKP
jgi:lipopolysaccharide biosynthesis glycosyltransferase